MIDDFVGSIEINKYKFSKAGSAEYVLNKYMNNSWPVVYIIKDDKIGEAYIGESTNAINRMKNHLANEQRNKLGDLLIVSCDKFNKSAVLDIESNLIQYMSSDGTYILQNGNAGLIDHNYYQREQYKALFKNVWSYLEKKQYAKNPLSRIDNSDLFKYSPYKALTSDQHDSVLQILGLLVKKKQNTIFVEGGAGTGKTILAIYLMKLLKTDIMDHHLDEEDESYSSELQMISQLKAKFKNPRVALVVPMTSLRKTLKMVFRNVKGLNAKMVIGPSEVSKNEYDLLIVDEAHRLRKRKNITNFKSFDDANKLLGFDIHKGTELDWILEQSKNQIFFYDEGQSIKPSDIDQQRFRDQKEKSFLLKLVSQLRVKGGMDYINYIDNLLHRRLETGDTKFETTDYEFIIYDSLSELYVDLKKKEDEFGLCRLLSGYSWEWKSAKKDVPDITIEGLNLKWNSINADWINSQNAFNEVGCIHTTQGYDLNYTGIIFGNEIKYNPETRKIEIDASQYFDKKGKQGIEDPDILKEYILNIYKTMMLRGIKGTFIYVCDDYLREYFKSFIPQIKPQEKEPNFLEIENVRPFENCVPLYDLKVAAGDFGEFQHVEDVKWIQLPERFKGSKDWFACQVIGESMNKIIPNGTYCLFKKYSGGSRNGQIVLVEHTNIQDSEFGSCYTIKEYESKKYQGEKGWKHQSIVLKPISSDDSYENIVLTDDELSSFKAIGVFECVL